MVDTWATVGSCAQIGKNVHLSGGVGIGGVLEPLQANPTIIGDNCFVGARSEVVEGVIVEDNCVISMGVYHRPEHQDLRPRHRRSHLRPRAGRLGGGQRQPALGRRQVQPVLRGHRQEGRRADAGQDRHQRTAARLSHADGTKEDTMGTMQAVPVDGGKEGFRPLRLGRRADQHQDQRQRRADQPDHHGSATMRCSREILTEKQMNGVRARKRNSTAYNMPGRRRFPPFLLPPARHAGHGGALHPGDIPAFETSACRRC
jgi:hypothetical protein